MSNVERYLYWLIMTLGTIVLICTLTSCDQASKEAEKVESDLIDLFVEEIEDLAGDVKKHNKSIRDEVSEIQKDVKKHNKGLKVEKPKQ